MNETARDIIIVILTVFGYVFLWGSLIIGFMDWTYDMASFRTSIMGLILIATKHYLKMKWGMDE